MSHEKIVVDPKLGAAQGDILILGIDTLPEGVEPVDPENGVYVVAHSETGHNHVIAENDIDLFRAANDPLNLYAVVNRETELKHLRSFDTHKTLTLPPGTYRFINQQEMTIEGWQRRLD